MENITITILEDEYHYNFEIKDNNTNISMKVQAHKYDIGDTPLNEVVSQILRDFLRK